MHFRIAARTILELGAELISSDGIALYELIKNALDAGARRVRIDVQVLVSRSQFDLLIEEVDTHPGGLAELRAIVADALAQVEEVRSSALMAKLASSKSRRNMKVVLHDWYVENNWIAVTDTGHGMSLQELTEVYLTVGTRSRLKGKSVAAAAGHRPPTGEKGVGRLSTMRLGDHLRVETSKSGEHTLSELSIDWTLFSHDSDLFLEDIAIEPRAGVAKSDPARSGTVVTVGALKADWDREKLQAIAQEEFSRLIDPWEGETANRIIRLSFNQERVTIPEIDRRYLDLAHGYCRAAYTVDGGVPRLQGVVDYRLRGKSRNFALGTAELLSNTNAPSVSILRSVGAFEMEMWWYNRLLITAKEGLGKRGDILAEIGRWSGGLMLFRDGFRVNPYGGGEDDWLQLDKKAFASKGYKLNRQQVIGRVRISWRNRGLQDQTNREGLVSTPEKSVLTALLRHILLTEFKTFIEREDAAVRVQERATLETVAERIESAEQDVQEKLREVESLVPRERLSLVRDTGNVVKELVRFVDQAKELSEEYSRDRAQLVYLAGIGLMVEFILHELDRATFGTLRTLKDIDVGRLDRPAAAAIGVLADQLETLNKRVSNLDALSTARRQVKVDIDVYQTVRRIVDSRAGETARLGIALDGNYVEDGRWRVRGVPGMFLQIIENLLANSFYWLRQQAGAETGFMPRVTVELSPDEGMLSVTDNGPGVDPSLAEAIFQPFVTRKPAGEGRGLGLYISRDLAENQGWRLDVLRESTVRPGRYNTFILNLSGKPQT